MDMGPSSPTMPLRPMQNAGISHLVNYCTQHRGIVCNNTAVQAYNTDLTCHQMNSTCVLRVAHAATGGC